MHNSFFTECWRTTAPGYSCSAIVSASLFLPCGTVSLFDRFSIIRRQPSTGVLWNGCSKTLQKIIGKYLQWSLVFRPGTVILLKKRTPLRVFSCDFCRILLQNTSRILLLTYCSIVILFILIRYVHAGTCSTLVICVFTLKCNRINIGNSFAYRKL